MKLAKADAEDANEDFERKRAWDWTIEESEKWDVRMQEKQRNRETANFADYTQASEKNYRKNMKGFKPDLEGYRKAKEEALDRGELIRTEDGEVVPVSGQGSDMFYATKNSLGLVDHKPSKDAVDRLVEETKKRYALCEEGWLANVFREAEKEANRRKKRAGEDGDINYINKRNKVFNEKLARYYDPYTRETREAFERGSAA